MQAQTEQAGFAVGEVHVAYIGDDGREPDENEGELYIHVREARKRFQQFLRTETRSLGSDEPYSAQLMRQQGQHRVADINLTDVKNYDGVLGQQLEEKPNTFLPLVRACSFERVKRQETLARMRLQPCML